MELKKIWETAKNAMRDKRLTWVVCALGLGGIVLIYLSSLFAPDAQPRGSSADTVASTPELDAGGYQRQLEEDLGRIVKAVTGEPSPEVMVTLENAGRAVYAEDKKISRQESGGEEETSHVILEDKEGAQQGLALSQEQPEVKGVVIVSRAAADPAVKEKLVNAARTALGVSSARVCVVEGG